VLFTIFDSAGIFRRDQRVVLDLVSRTVQLCHRGATGASFIPVQDKQLVEFVGEEQCEFLRFLCGLLRSTPVQQNQIISCLSRTEKSRQRVGTLAGDPLLRTAHGPVP